MSAVGLCLWGAIMSLNLNKKSNMKNKKKQKEMKHKLKTRNTEKLIMIKYAVITTAQAILTSFLGGTPMLA
jgi:hypothetical protein